MAKNYLNQNLKSEILSRLETSNLTRPELAKEVGIGTTTLSKIITGEQRFTGAYARKFSTAFNLEENHFNDFIYYEVEKKKLNFDGQGKTEKSVELPQGTVAIPFNGEFLIFRRDELKEAWDEVNSLRQAVAENEAKAEPDGP